MSLALSNLLLKEANESSLLKRVKGRISLVNEDPIPIVFFNSLSWTRNETAELIVDTENVEVVDISGNNIQAQILPLFNTIEELQTKQSFKLLFSVKVPPFGVNTYYIKSIRTKPEKTFSSSVCLHSALNQTDKLSVISEKPKCILNRDHFEIENKDTAIGIRANDGGISFWKDKKTKDSLRFKFGFFSYKSLDTPWFSTGMYMFRINWGIWYHIGLGVGLAIGMLLAYGIHLVLRLIFYILGYGLYASFLSYFTHRKVNKFITFLMITLSVAGAAGSFLSVFQLTSDNMYKYALGSIRNVGIPVGAIIGIIITLLFGFKKLITFVVCFALSYCFVFLGQPWVFAREIIKESQNVHIRGPLVEEVTHIVPSERIFSQTRMFHHNPHFIEFSFNLYSAWNSDLVCRLTVQDIKSNGFFTDCNDLWNLNRRYNYFEVVPGNYYPITSTVAIQDSKHRVSVVSEIPVGTTVFDGNTFEIMLHRFPVIDDERGLHSGLYSQGPAEFRIRLLFENSNQPSVSKRISAELQNPLFIFQGTANSTILSYSRIFNDTMLDWLNENGVQLLSIQYRNDLDETDGYALRFLRGNNNRGAMNVDLDLLFQRKWKFDANRASLTLNSLYPVDNRKHHIQDLLTAFVIKK